MALGHRILVPLDGSRFAERALPLATNVAEHAEGTLHLLSVHVPWAPADMPFAVAATVVAEAETAAREALRLYLDRVSAQLRERGVAVDTAIRVGAAASSVLDVATELDCDLIAMSTHGRGGFERLWLGSVADRVVRESRIPVLLVSAREPAPDDRSAEPPAPRGLRTVIVPLDGSSFARQALVPATSLGDAFSAEYVLFRAVPASAPILAIAGDRGVAVAETVEKERAEARRGVDHVADRLRDAGYSVTVMIEEEADPTRALLALAEATPDAVIAMTTHGRGGLGRALLGSMADKVVRASSRPVLLVRPHAD